MFAVGQDIDVLLGTVWRRGNITAVTFDSNNEMTYTVLVRWEFPNNEYVEAKIDFTAEDIANGAFRRI